MAVSNGVTGAVSRRSSQYWLGEYDYKSAEFCLGVTPKVILNLKKEFDNAEELDGCE